MAIKVLLKRREHWIWTERSPKDKKYPYSSYNRLYDPLLLEWFSQRGIEFKAGTMDVWYKNRTKPLKEAYVTFKNPRDALHFAIVWDIPGTYISSQSITYWKEVLRAALPMPIVTPTVVSPIKVTCGLTSLNGWPTSK